MQTKPIIINTVMADITYSIENVERLGVIKGVDLEQIDKALGILRATREKLMRDILDGLSGHIVTCGNCGQIMEVDEDSE